ncbi:MAG: hypothetical protein IKJ23_08815 [Bacteroidaceae bacterium]|nr:hypothetical protein [Bacteroidaceae bacterium]
MKNLLKVLLGVIAIILIVVNVRSIMSPIEFEAVRVHRDSAVIARLIDIKNAQVEYKGQYGRYTNSFDTLIGFLKNYKLPIVKKAYELNDMQLESVANIKRKRAKVKEDAEISLTVDEADKIILELIAKANENGDWKELNEISALNRQEGSIRENFHRDTMWVSLVDTLYHDPNYPVDSLRYIPFGNGEEFTLLADSIPTKSGGQQFLFEARADFDQYLKGINEQEYNNYILSIKKNVTQVRREPVLDEKGEPKYDENNEEVVTLIPCRRVGNVKEPNNNAGNWE